MIRAKCDLTIEFDKPERRYRPGERITGQIRVRADAETKCDGLRLDWQWRTHGRGNRAAGPKVGVELHRGTWRPGTHTYRFDFVCPSQPTYHGTLLNVDWYLDVRADVPWAIDAKSSLDFFVEYPPEQPYDLVIQDSQAAHVASNFALVFIGLFWIPGFVLLGVGLTEDAGALIGAAIWLAVMVFITGAMVKKRVAKSVFTRFEPQLSGGVDGHPLIVELDYATNKRVNAVEARLEAQEVVVKGSGTDKTTYRQNVYRSGTREIVGSIGQHRMRFELAMPHPSTVGYSFDATDNDLDWFVILDIDIESWPDLEERIDLRVLPRAQF